MRLALFMLLATVMCTYADDSAAAGAADSELFTVEGSIKMPSTIAPAALLATRVLLNGGEFTAIPRADGAFSFSNVPLGTHLLEVANTAFVFETLRIEVSGKDGGKIKVNPLNRRERLHYPLQLRPVAEAHYYQARDGFNVLALFSSPMGIMVAIGVFFMICMPRLMSSMDPEELKEFQRRQAQMNPAAMMQSLQKKVEDAKIKAQ